MSKRLDCKFSKKLNAYLDNELDETDFIKLKDHLRSCPICQQEIRELNKLNTLLRSFQEEEVTDLLKENIISQIISLPESNIFSKNNFIKLTVAASIAASFIIGLFFSSIVFKDEVEFLTEFSLGQESLYSYNLTE
jgi:predicted anti-sigma-YlaC factor YlaD